MIVVQVFQPAQITMSQNHAGWKACTTIAYAGWKACTTMTLRIGNACGFWGDAPDAPARLVAQAPDLDYLTLDYLAEVSMSILARQRERRPELGYPADFIE